MLIFNQLLIQIDHDTPPIFIIPGHTPKEERPFRGFSKSRYELKFCTSKYEAGKRSGKQFITAAEMPVSHKDLCMDPSAVVDAGFLIFDVTTQKITVRHGSETFYKLKDEEDRATTRALLEKAIRKSPHLSGWTILDQE